MADLIRCEGCSTPLPDHYYNVDHFTPCPGCFKDIQIRVFPAYFRPVPIASPNGLVEAGDAACYYHPDNAAVVPCHSCGRFLCAVCHVDFAGESWCAGCVHAGLTTRKHARLENRRVRYDSVALAVAAIPMLLIWPTPITAPIAIFLTIRYWRAPSGAVPRTKVRFVVALLLGLAQLGFWGFAAYAVAVTRGWV